MTTTTTEVETTTTAEPTTTAPAIEPVEPGTGVLTVGDTDYPFTVTDCSFEPTVNEPLPTGAVTISVFEVEGTASAEGQQVLVSARRTEWEDGRVTDSIGYGYATDPNDFESLVAVRSEIGLDTFLVHEGTTVAGGPVPFDRTEGISVNAEADPGQGSLVATC